MSKALAIAALLAAVGAAQAEPSAAKKELIDKVLKLQQGGLESMARSMAEQPAMQLMQQAGPAVQRLPAERREAVAREIEGEIRKYIDETTPIVRDHAIKLAPSTIGVVLDEKFSEDDLRQVITLLESPAFHKLQTVAPDMQRALADKLIPDARAEVEPKVRALSQTVGQRLSAAQAAAAPASAAPASAAAAAKTPAKGPLKPASAASAAKK
jgi:hypothetical protein